MPRTLPSSAGRQGQPLLIATPPAATAEVDTITVPMLAATKASAVQRLEARARFIPERVETALRSLAAARGSS